MPFNRDDDSDWKPGKSFEEWTDREFDLSDPVQAGQYRKAKRLWRRWYSRQLSLARQRRLAARRRARQAAALARRLERQRLRRLREEERLRQRLERQRLRQLRLAAKGRPNPAHGGPPDLEDEIEPYPKLGRRHHRRGSLNGYSSLSGHSVLSDLAGNTRPGSPAPARPQRRRLGGAVRRLKRIG